MVVWELVVVSEGCAKTWSCEAKRVQCSRSSVELKSIRISALVAEE